MNHTPGPWTVRRYASGYFVTAPSENGSSHEITIAEFREAQHGAMYAHRAKQDAELFAVAPKLLAALRDLVERCDGAEGVRADGSNIQTMHAHAVLDKAEEGGA